MSNLSISSFTFTIAGKRRNLIINVFLDHQSIHCAPSIDCIDATAIVYKTVYESATPTYREGVGSHIRAMELDPAVPTEHRQKSWI
jgi:hypothetical protein